MVTRAGQQASSKHPQKPVEVGKDLGCSSVDLELKVVVQQSARTMCSFNPM